jgi:hypothetical protein
VQRYLWLIPGTVILLIPALVQAVGGVTDHNTFFFKSYQDNWQGSISSGQTQYDDWNDEMADISDCNWCNTNPDLENYMTGVWINEGHDADLIAIMTHGSKSGVNGTFNAKLASWPDEEWAVARNMEPTQGESEIYLFGSCSIFNTDATSTWFGYRNLHRRGARMSVGCWNPCTVVEEFSLGISVNSTWNIMGDEIADEESKIWTGWKRAWGLGPFHNPVITVGLGKVSNSDCDERALNVTFQNRLDFPAYTYGHNAAQGTFEFCGFFNTT